MMKGKGRVKKVGKASAAGVALRAKVLDIEAGQNEIALNEAQAKMLDLSLGDRVRLSCGKQEAVAMVNYSHAYVREGEIELFAELSRKLNVKTGDTIQLLTTQRPASLDYIRKKMDGQVISKSEIDAIIRDLMNEQLSSAELAAFIAAVYINELNSEETAALTNAIYESGDRLELHNGAIVSEHSIGGVAGDRVSMLIVPLLASLGITIPKTCTRAISSASGTADTMEVLCPVSLSVEKIKKVVAKTKCCLVWGGAVNMAVADDKLIKIRNPLHLDPKALLLASILAKKKAEGATHVLLDIPIGKGAKISELEPARELAQDFQALGARIGLKIEVIITDGSEPVSYEIGPALEARAVLRALAGEDSVLLEKSCRMVALVLHMVKGVTKEEGYRMAMHQVRTGKGITKFRELIKAQGGNGEIEPEDIKVGSLTYVVKADVDGKVEHIDNKAISKICRALGCPNDKQAGMVIHTRMGNVIKAGEPIYTLYATNKERLDYAVSQTKSTNVVEIERIIIETV